MRSALFLGLCAGFVFLGACTDLSGRPGDTVAEPKQLRQRQVVVTLAQHDPEHREAIAQSLASRYNVQEAGRFPLESIGVQCAVFDVPGDRSLDLLIAAMGADPQIESVQRNQFFEDAQDGSADPYARLEYGAVTIRADAAHRVSTGKGVRVTAIDTGADTNHPDLRGRIAKVANFVDGGEGSFASDRHGTAVAGIIGARADNGVGIFGIAPDAELQVAKACWYSDAASGKARCSSWTLAKAIDFAIREKTRVLNLSLKGPADALLERLLLMAETQGIVVVAAAGEDSSNPGFPAVMPSVIAVIASDAIGDIRPFKWLDARFAVAAPGVDILTTVPSGNYDFVTGASFSAAEVTGVVALLIERKPDLQPDDVRALLRRSAHPLSNPGRSSRVIAGVVDACAALSDLSGVAVCP